MRIFKFLFWGFVFILAFGCNKDQALPDDNHQDSSIFRIEFLKSYPLDIAEPSGLSWDKNHENFLVVDDNTNRPYIINKQGFTIDTLAYLGDDTEGITIKAIDGTIWVAEERLYQITQLDSLGNLLNTYPLYISHDKVNKGLEGICFSLQNQSFYLLNEASPGLLINWLPESGVIGTFNLSFAEDYSGIFSDAEDKNLWIISDQSQELFYCTNQGKVLQSFDLDFPKAEGIVVDLSSERLYIVSDSERKLFTYKITKL